MNISDIENAIYFDFESNPNKPPSIVGWLYKDLDSQKDVFEQFILEGPLNATDQLSKNTQISNLNRFLNKLRRKAIRENRYLIAWSNNEKEVIKDYGGVILPVSFWDQYYVNGIPHAKNWHYRIDPTNLPPRGQNTLSYYMQYTGYIVPIQFGPGTASIPIEEMREELNRTHFHMENVPLGTKNKWKGMLKHNKHDCIGMRHVMRTIYNALKEAA